MYPGLNPWAHTILIVAGKYFCLDWRTVCPTRRRGPLAGGPAQLALERVLEDDDVEGLAGLFVVNLFRKKARSLSKARWFFWIKGMRQLLQILFRCNSVSMLLNSDVKSHLQKEIQSELFINDFNIFRPTYKIGIKSLSKANSCTQ